MPSGPLGFEPKANINDCSFRDHRERSQPVSWPTGLQGVGSWRRLHLSDSPNVSVRSAGEQRKPGLFDRRPFAEILKPIIWLRKPFSLNRKNLCELLNFMSW